ncbi:MAG TPA: 2Fe-2S iron-sulfur cluster-binding protein [Acidisarcina sp.]
MKSTDLYPPCTSSRVTTAEEESVTSSEQQQAAEETLRWDVSRRNFLKSAGLLGGATAIGMPTLAAAQRASAVTATPVTLSINGEEHHLTLDPRTTLLDALREDLHLTGSKKGCDHGQCGACTVLLNGRRINSCLTLALSVEGDQVTTVEGLAKGEELHPVQQAFLDHDGFQCGYCTPGQICSAVALLDEARHGEPSQLTMPVNQPGPINLTVEETKERMSGNICRCGAYPGIVAAVMQASGQSTASATRAGQHVIQEAS